MNKYWMIGLWFLCQVLNFFGWDLWIDQSYVLAGILLLGGFICGTIAVVVNSKEVTRDRRDPEAPDPGRPD